MEGTLQKDSTGQATDARVLYVVLTAGNERHLGFLKPSDTGQLRWRAAVNHLENYHRKDGEILICGGLRSVPWNCEAVVLRKWAAKCYPNNGVNHSGAHVLAEGKYTAADMVALANWLKREGRVWRLIYLVSHLNHAQYAAMTLRACGIDSPLAVVDSGEQPPYSGLMLSILTRIYGADPKWERPWWRSPTTALLRWVANRRGRNE